MTVLVGAGIRLRLLDVPLDRDEGEYAYFGQLLLDGVPPYIAAYNMKLPGIYGLYAAILAVFGQSPAGIHLGLLCLHVVTPVLVFALAFQAFNQTVAATAAATFTILSLSPKLHGFAAYAEHFVLLPALAGALILLRAIRSCRLATLFTSGVFLGLAFVIKQSGGAFVLFGALYALLDAFRRRAAGGGRPVVVPPAVLVLGALLPFAVVCVAVALTGVFGKFWFWTVTYAYHYGSTVGLADGLTLFAHTFSQLLATSYLIFALAGIGLVVLLVSDHAGLGRLFLMLLTACSILGTATGLYFRAQYYLLLLPSVALLVGIAVDASAGGLASRASALRLTAPLLLAAVALGHLLVAERAILLERPPERVSRDLFGLNPFPESIEVARYIMARTTPSDRIAVIGSEPQIYFYAHRRGATGYVYMYPLTEDQPYALQMQREMIVEIEAATPKLVVFVNLSSSWLQGRTGPESARTVFEWWKRYRLDFDRVGVADIVKDGPTRYVWGADAAAYVPQSGWVGVFERRSSTQ